MQDFLFCRIARKYVMINEVYYKREGNALIRHIYLFTLKDKSKAKEIAAKIMTMKECVPYLKHIEVGVDFKGAENSFDLAEVCTFDTMEDFIRFGTDPYHGEIRSYMETVRETGIKIDYEF